MAFKPSKFNCQSSFRASESHELQTVSISKSALNYSENEKVCVEITIHQFLSLIWLMAMASQSNFHLKAVLDPFRGVMPLTGTTINKPRCRNRNNLLLLRLIAMFLLLQCNRDNMREKEQQSLMFIHRDSIFGAKLKLRVFRSLLSTHANKQAVIF